MRGLSLIASYITQFNRMVGKSAAWCTLLLVILVFVIALLRYVFKIGSIPMQEVVIYLHGIIFMVGASYTLADDSHVRVDVVYTKMSQESKAWVNLLGTIFFLIPVSSFIFSISIDYVTLSWRINESSPEAGGLPYLFLLKSLIIVLPALLLLQGIAIICNSLVTIFNKETRND